MKATEVIAELQYLIDEHGDLQIDVSVTKYKTKAKQNYLIANANTIVMEDYTENRAGKRICIRNWPF